MYLRVIYSLMKTIINILLIAFLVAFFSCKKQEVIQKTDNSEAIFTLKDGEKEVINDSEDDSSGIVETEDEDEDEDDGIIIVETEDEDEDEDDGIIIKGGSDSDDGGKFTGRK